MIRDCANGSEHPLCHGATVEGIGRREDLFLDLRSKAHEAQDLCYPSTGDSLLAGNIRLSGNLAGFQAGLPFDGFSEEFDDSGILGTLAGLGLPGGTALTIRLGGARSLRAPMLPFSNAPLGPRAISTVCSR